MSDGDTPGPDDSEPNDTGDKDTVGKEPGKGMVYADWAKLMEVYSQAISLVEETADYLSNEGEQEKEQLPPLALTAFMSESMRLTTRLTTMMSWLMLQRAVADEEITADEVRKSEHRLRRLPNTLEIDGITKSMLPERLSDLVERSMTLYKRVERLEKQFFAGEKENPVQSMINRIESEIKDR